MTIFHLVRAADFAGLNDGGHYAPASLRTEGFVHACGTGEVATEVANAYFPRHGGPVLALELATDGLDVRWEAPASPDGRPRAHHTPGRTFPHVYGVIPLTSVVAHAWLLDTHSGWQWPSRWTAGPPR